MPGFVRKILIFITGYAWLLLIAGPGLIGMSVWSQWKAEGDHAYKPREQLETLAGTVTAASEVTVKRKRRTTKQYYEITVTPQAGGAERKLRIDHGTPSTLVGNLIDEKITALFDASDSDIAYEIVTNGQPVIAYESTKQRMLKEAQSNAASFSGAGMWIFAILLTLVGAAGVWANRRLRQADENLQVAAA
ncbi:hypothetical protein [Acidovorax sp. FJL06]|uniref:hypothetical protein n=1 Tax=Acidovorax sp. FJL06 TaxID=2153365 RepID=UPI000F57ABE8|nr:hypothetical protein [Acidovorax sp. FJL06]RQO82597.1 hypothetical protein DBV10_07490 [Acidovorax sp. FJL06]